MAGGRNQRSAQRQSAHAATASSAAPPPLPPPPPPHGSPPPPPLPPPLPPTPVAPLFEDLVNEPVRIYPLDRPASRANASPGAHAPPATARGRLLQALQTLGSPAVVVGVVVTEATSATGVYTFLNRLIGRVAFVESVSVADSAFGAKPSLLSSVQLYYDASRSCVFLLGVSKPDTAFLADLELNDDVDRDFGADLTHFQSERRKVELLVHSCSHVLFQFNERGKITTNILKNIRSLASEKQSLLALLSASNGKKRNDKASSHTANVLAPGRCVPLVMFVVPARDEIINATHKQLTTAASIKSRSSTVAFCKSQEAMLCGLFRSLRGGVVGALRARDAVAPANLSKERRLFHVDPAHCVTVLSHTSSSAASCVHRRFDALLSSLSVEFLTMDTDQSIDLDDLLAPLEEDDIGFPTAVQHLHRGVELFQNASSSSVKDAGGVKMDLLSVGQWLKGFQSLVKTLHRAETKKKQEAANDRDSMRHQFDHMEIRS